MAYYLHLFYYIAYYSALYYMYLFYLPNQQLATFHLLIVDNLVESLFW